MGACPNTEEPPIVPSPCFVNFQKNTIDGVLTDRRAAVDTQDDPKENHCRKLSFGINLCDSATGRSRPYSRPGPRSAFSGAGKRGPNVSFFFFFAERHTTLCDIYIYSQVAFDIALCESEMASTEDESVAWLRLALARVGSLLFAQPRRQPQNASLFRSSVGF